VVSRLFENYQTKLGLKKSNLENSIDWIRNGLTAYLKTKREKGRERERKNEGCRKRGMENSARFWAFTPPFAKKNFEQIL
jgi:hypothetical protein